MFDQLKSLLRRSSNHHHHHGSTRLQNGLPSSASQKKGSSNETSKYAAASDRNIVREENKPDKKQRLPCYQGLERYRLIAKLGDGAFSNVYKAVDLETDQMVAVKAVRKLELSQTQRASVLKEVQLMRTINHPSIVKLYRFVETKEHYFLILELCEGGELFHRIVRLTYFSEDLSRHCIAQVAEGIRYLHEEKGIVHRDIKPENLLFEPIPFMERVSPLPPQQPMDDDEPKEDEGEFVPGLGGGGIGRVKIADFGLSKVVWDQQTMTPCGTVGYTAPEIIKDERYSKSVDMWALGCVLYTLLCGFPPFYDDNVKELTEKVARGQYSFLSPWWDNISDSAKDLISHLLCINPDERFTIDQFFAHPWMQQKPSTSQRKEERAMDEDKASVSEDDADDDESTPDSSTATSSDTDDEVKTNPVSADSDVHIPSVKQSSARYPITDVGAVSAPRNIPYSSSTEMTNSRRRDLFSPDITAMKEMFDVSYAVQRITEEKGRQQQTSSQRSSRRAFAAAIDAQYDCDQDEQEQMLNERLRRACKLESRVNSNSVDANEPTARLNEVSSLGNPEPQLAPPPTQEATNKLLSKTKARKSKPVFELSMDNATLLGRRRKPNCAVEEHPSPKSPLARASPSSPSS